VKLNHEKLRSLAQEANVSAEALADALPKDTGRRKERERALACVQGWLAGKNRPAPTRAEIEAMASVLGVQPSELSRFVSVSRWQRSSPRKARLLTDLIKGRPVDEAMNILRFNPKRAAVMVNKALKAAVADAETNDAAVERLVVAESRVDEGVIIKRFQPKDRGRAHPIQKKTSHIIVGVEERD
jgi:large subunit ribosomal protein L22